MPRGTGSDYVRYALNRLGLFDEAVSAASSQAFFLAKAQRDGCEVVAPTELRILHVSHEPVFTLFHHPKDCWSDSYRNFLGQGGFVLPKQKPFIKLRAI